MIFRDLRYGVRSLLQSPALTAIAVVALALGIGLTGTMFSIVYGALVRGLPFDKPEEIVAVWRTNLSRDVRRMGTPVHDLEDWKRSQHSFQDLGASTGGTVNLSGTERAERFDGAWVTANTFKIVRVGARLGRVFREGEDRPGAEPVMLIGHGVWRDKFGSDPDVVGRVVRANGVPTTIVGVMPEKFAFPEDQEVWLPMKQDAVALPRGQGTWLEVFGRLEAGVSAEQAAQDLNAIARRIAAEHPKTNEGVGVNVRPYTDTAIGPEPRALLMTMLGAVFLVLLVACGNVANLLLGRAAHRSREVGIRTALGASRAAVVRQFLAESLALSFAGAAIGVGIAWAGVTMFNRAIADTDPPFWLDFKVDVPVLGFVVAIAVLASLVAGLLPAWQASKADISTVLKDESRGASSFRIGRMSRAIVVFEIALSCGLLVAAGLMVKSVTKLRTVDFGFGTEDVFTARVGLPEADPKYKSDTAQTLFFEQVAARVAAIPGVRTSALASNLPALGSGGDQFAKEGQTYAREQDHPRARTVAVTPSFFTTFGAKPLQGRLLDEQDRKGSGEVVVINQSFAKKHFANESPLGRRIRLAPQDTASQWATIVGVIPDLWANQPGEKEQVEAVYIPFAQHPRRFVSVAARVQGPNPMRITPQVRAAVSAADPDIPLYFVDTLAGAIAQRTWFYRVFGTIFMIFGVVALFLAAVGLYGVMSFTVGRRTREMGVRMALGAQPRSVVGLIMRQGLGQLGIGMVAGLALAAGVANLLKIVLFDVQPRDPAVFGGVVLTLVATGVLANLVPARRATRVDPMIALRTE
ncbi:MAG: ABC transporter permease [Gemmatimonadaceae bacterium]